MIELDEVAWRTGHVYLTLVYQLDTGYERVLRIGQDSKITTLESFFECSGNERTALLQVACSDMRQATCG